MQGYSAKEVAKMLDLSVEQVRSYARAGIIEPDRGPRGEYRFSFQDLVLLRTAEGLRTARIPPRRLRNALIRLKDQLPDGFPLSSIKIRAEGDRIVVRRGGQSWNPESGQATFDFEVSELASKVAPHVERVIEAARHADQALTSEDWYELAFGLEAVAPEQAEEAYRKALEVDPDNVDARINLGRLLHVTGKLPAAEEQFRIAVRHGKPNATALFNLGVALEDLQRGDEAMEYYRAAIEVDPECADAYFNLARLYEKTGDARSALRYLSAYRKLIEHI